MNPFSNSKSLAAWTAFNLKERGIDEIADWRMLEYWFQVEIFRLARLNKAGSWHHIGYYEQPYYTDIPRSGSKTKTKWIDLVFAEPNPLQPRSIIWLELKDIGRSKDTVINNARGLGHDLAALWALSPIKTKELWLHPLPHSIDRGRIEEWNKFGPHLDEAKHFIGQIVIGPIDMQDELSPQLSPERIINVWLESFIKRTGSNGPLPGIVVESTARFYVYGLVMELPR